MRAAMRYGSLFAGIEGFGLGFSRAGLVGSWAVEIEPDCRSVIRRHFPEKQLHEDVRSVGAAELSPVDVLCGGFPCQDLSVAGKRGGLAGERSGLFFEMLRIIDELRPRYVAFENVGGLSTSDDGRDFPRILRGLADVGYFGAVRLVDARWYGVPQRRRRYFGVFARCDSGAEWRRACEVLAVPESLQRHPAESGKAREDVAANAAGSFGSSGIPDVAGTLGVSKGRGWCDDIDRATFIPTNYTDGTCEQSETAGALTKLTDQSRGVLTVIPIDMRQASRGATMTNNRPGGSSGGAPGTGIGEPGDPCPTLSGSHVPAVASFDTRNITSKANRTRVEPGLPCGTLHSEPQAVILPRVGVRRMTPLECERTQGFPDSWTEFDADGKRLSDSRRYAMIGNSVVPQVAEWLGRRLMQHA